MGRCGDVEPLQRTFRPSAQQVFLLLAPCPGASALDQQPWLQPNPVVCVSRYRPRVYCLADSDEESSSAGSSDEEDSSELSNDSAGGEG